jgi:hypothetical protein
VRKEFDFFKSNEERQRLNVVLLLYKKCGYGDTWKNIKLSAERIAMNGGLICGFVGL